ncbi:unnamed protein product, partial [Prorocentrum cordatum]
TKLSLEPAAADGAAPVSRTVQHTVAQWRELLRHEELRSLMLVNCVSLAAHAGRRMHSLESLRRSWARVIRGMRLCGAFPLPTPPRRGL